MTPRPFKEANRELLAPKGMTNCEPLPVHCDGGTCISKWTLGWRERLNVLIHGTIWLRVFSGKTQPPVSLQAAKTIFRKANRNEMVEKSMRLFRADNPNAKISNTKLRRVINEELDRQEAAARDALHKEEPA